MNRRDIVIIAVLINIGLLALLFITAINHDEEANSTQDVSSFSHEEAIIVQDQISNWLPEESSLTMIADEVDQALQSHISTSQPVVIPIEPVESTPVVVLESPKEKNEQGSTEQAIEVIVKKGDSLDKIARLHNSSVELIRRANHLKTDRLDIGQKLQVPIETRKVTSTHEIKQENIGSKASKEGINEPEYYIIKKGDNPWKLAKKYNVDFEDLLKLNNLNEEKARNLKIGDRIRVK